MKPVAEPAPTVGGFPVVQPRLFKEEAHQMEEGRPSPPKRFPNQKEPSEIAGGPEVHLARGRPAAHE